MKSACIVVFLWHLLVPFSVSAGEWLIDSKMNCRIWNTNPAQNKIVSWSGQCVEGFASGSGTVVWYKNGKETERYEGEMRGGKPHVKGTLTWSNGGKYVGDWVDGKRTGKGTLTGAYGYKYVGDFVDDKFHGKGTYSCDNGEPFTGNFENDRPVSHERTILKKNAEVFWKSGIDAFKEGQYEVALRNFNSSLSIYQKVCALQSVLDVMTWVAGLRNRMGDFHGAVDCLAKATKISKETGISPTKNAGYKDLNRAYEAMKLWAAGKDAEKAGNKDLADKMFERWAILSFKDMNDNPTAINELQFILRNVSKRLASDDYATAIDYIKMARNIYKNLPKDKDVGSGGIKDKIEASEYHATGHKCFQEGNYDLADKNYQKALQLYKDLNDKELWALLCFQIGVMYHQYSLKYQTDHERGIEYFNQAIHMYTLLGQVNMVPIIQHAVYLLKGHQAQQRGPGGFSEAEEYYNKSLEIAEKQNDPKMKRRAYDSLTLLFLKKNDHYGLIQIYEKKLELDPLGKDAKEMCGNLKSIGFNYYMLGRQDKALEYYQQALAIAKHIKDINMETEILADIVEPLIVKGKYQESMERLLSVIDLTKKTGNKKTEARAHKLMGDLYAEIGDWEKTIDNYLYSIKIADDIGLTEDKGAIYSKIGRSYRELMFRQEIVKKPQDDLFFKSLEYYDKAFNEYQKLGNHIGEDQLYGEMAGLARASGNKDITIGYLQRAIQKDTDSGSPASLMVDYNIAGETYFIWRDYAQSLLYLKKGLELSKQLGLVGWELRFLLQIGAAYTISKNYNTAEYTYEQAMRLSEGLGFIKKVNVLAELGWSMHQAGQYEKAKHYLSEAIRIIELTRSSLKLDEIRSSYDSDTNKLGVYVQMINTLLKLGHREEAFHYAERAKARTYLDLLGNKLPANQYKNKELSKQEYELLQKINLMLTNIEKEQSQLKEKQRAVLDAWREELERSMKEYSDLMLRIKVESPELSSLVSVDPLTLKEVQGLLDSDTTLLEYFVDFEKTLLWVVSKSGVNVIEIPVQDFVLFNKVGELRKKIMHCEVNYTKDAYALYKLLIEPARPYIKTKRVAIVPHSKLHYLPFHALISSVIKDPDSTNKRKITFLIEEYDIFYLPSASVLKFVYQKRKNITGKVLAFGNPYLDDRKLDLPYAEEEVKNIQSIYPDTAIYLGRQATKGVAIDLSVFYNIIHFASHGELNSKAPLFSSIRLAREGNKDGRLEAHEIFDLNLENATLVTLSACETGLGKLTNGDEYVGLTRAFIYAGTPSVLASLWKVNDQSTAKLMKLFYCNLKTHPKSEALRKAQLEMIKGKTGRGIVRGVGGITTDKPGTVRNKTQRTVDGSHPYFWAPFVLFGDWQ